jgi:hypothetical protein
VSKERDISKAENLSVKSHVAQRGIFYYDWHVLLLGRLLIDNAMQ